jgi:hypothetical protein
LAVSVLIRFASVLLYRRVCDFDIMTRFSYINLLVVCCNAVMSFAFQVGSSEGSLELNLSVMSEGEMDRVSKRKFGYLH